MKIKFENDKKYYMILAAVSVPLIAACVLIRFAWWAVPVFLAALWLLLGMRVELHEKLPWIWTLVLFAGGAILTTFCIQYLLLEPDLFRRTSNFKWTLNILCILAFYLFTLVFTNHAGISCAISHVLLVLFGFADYFVYMFRQNEITFADLESVGTGLSVAENYQFQITARCIYVILWSVLFVLFALKCEVRFKQRIQMSVLAVLLSVLCGVSVAVNVGGINTETWEMKGTYRNGFTLNFLLSIRDSFVSAPEGYSVKAVEELEELYREDVSEASSTNTETPTVIVIMNESFADLGVLSEDGLKTNLPLTPFFDSLQENTVRGYALASIFGAKTPNSEWEFQTGNSMAFLPGGSVVYQQYINSTPASIVSTFKNEGYTCVAMHPYYETGWSRDSVYPKLGFDESYFLDDFDQTKILRKYVTDEELYSKVIQRYENRGDGEKLYLFGVTMQNHGGYTEDYDNFEEKYYKAGTSYTDVNQYLSLVHESDEALRYLVEYFEQVEEPVEIVFFGDHQPSLNSGFYQMMNGKGLSGLTKAELQNLYKVPFAIWTNYESQEREVPITSLNFLSTLALQQAGMELPPYNRFLADMMEVVPAINSRGYYSLAGNGYKHVEDAEGIEADWIARYELLQYNSMFDAKNRSELFFPYFTQ